MDSAGQTCGTKTTKLLLLDSLLQEKMPNVDLVTKAEVVNYDRHGFSRPNLWHRPIAKVYDVNKITGNVLYRPMINYINKKEAFKTFTGFENSAAVREATTLERPIVEMPSADEMYQLCQDPDVESGPLRLGNFLVNARAQQTRERNKRAVHCKHLRSLASLGLKQSSDTLGHPRTSASVRDKYVEELSTYYATGVGKLETFELSGRGPWSRLE